MSRNSLVAVAAFLGLLASQSVLGQEPGILSELERTASTTPAQKVEYASGANEEMRAASKSVVKLLDAVRRNSNPSQETVDCLNGRLTSIRALLQVGEGAETSLSAAVAAGESERANHEFRKIAVARTKARQLLAEAQRCTTEGSGLSGDFEVKFSGGLEGDADQDVALWVEATVDDWSLAADPPDASPFL